MTGRIFFSFILCLLTNPLMNVLWVELYGLKLGWMYALDFVFIVGCFVILINSDKIESEINKLKVCNENRVKEIVELEREIDELKKEIKKT